jgi:ribosomal protein S21|tara:strand:+ start:455 stop:676 length:222 start_codon:yes stop_codon:yes gene_type:complete
MAKRPVNVSTKPRGRNDTQERMIRRFIRKCKKERVIERVRENSYYEKPSVVRRKAAKKRRRVLDKLREKERNS